MREKAPQIVQGPDVENRIAGAKNITPKVEAKKREPVKIEDFQTVPDGVGAPEVPNIVTPEPVVEPPMDVPVVVEVEPSELVPLVEKPAEAPKPAAAETFSRAENTPRSEEAFFENFFNKRNRDPKEFEEWFRSTEKNIEGIEFDPKEKNKHLKKLKELREIIENLPETGATPRKARKDAERILQYLSNKNMVVLPDVEEGISLAKTVTEAPQPDMENGITTPLPTEAAEEAPKAIVAPVPAMETAPAGAVDNESIQKAEQTIEAIPEKQRRQFYRGFLGLGYTVRGLKSEALAKIAGMLEEELDSQAAYKVKEGMIDSGDVEDSLDGRRHEVIKKQDSFFARMVRGSAATYRHDADEALRNLDKIYAEGEKSQAVKGVMSSVQFAALVGQVAFRGASKTFNPFKTVGASLLALGKGVEIAKEARLSSLERIEKNRLTYDEALVEAEQISEELRKERGSEKFTSNEYQQEYVKRLPKELLDRLKASDVSRLGWASQKAYADIKKTLEKIEVRIESAPKGKQERLQKFLGKGFQERYLLDVERLLERDGTIDVVAYGLKKAEKYTKAGAALATIEALAGAFFDYDALTHSFGHAVDTADPAHPETLLGLDENRTPSPIKYEWSGMTTDSMHAAEPNPLIPESFLSGHGGPHEPGSLLPKEEVVFDEAPETALLKISKRGPEGSIIDYFKDHKDVAERFGWDGKGDIKKWAGTKAHALWLEHASKALENDVTKQSLAKLGYTNDVEGYAKMMSRIKSGGITLDIEHKGVTLSNMEYLNAHEGVGAASLEPKIIETIDVERAPIADIETLSDNTQGESVPEEVDDSQLWKKRGVVLHDSPVGEESVSAEDVDDKQLWKTKEPALHAKPVDESLVLDTRGMSVPEAVVERMNHDLTEVLGPEDEGRVVWDKFKDYGARRFQNLSLDSEQDPNAVQLQEYLKNLETRSGLRPRAHILWFNQTVDQYIRRALKVIELKSRS